MAHLAVLAFDEREPNPAGGDVCTKTYRRIAGPKPVGLFGDFCLARLGVVAFDLDALAELADRIIGDLTVHLSQIGARVLVFRVEKFHDEFSVVCQ